VRDPDEALVRRAQRGDRFAFERLVAKHQNRLYTLAGRILGSPEDAADAVQEAFIRAWTNLPKFRRGATFSTWLYRICANAAYDIGARRSRAGQARPLQETVDPRDPIAQRELSSELQRALNELDEAYRVAVVLFDVLGCSYAEVAEITGVAEGTVKSRIFRGRTELARRLGTPGGRRESNG
jgi:RNA polymerase sigma-70 factor (ECF subfamily)